MLPSFWDRTTLTCINWCINLLSIYLSIYTSPLVQKRVQPQELAHLELCHDCVMELSRTMLNTHNESDGPIRVVVGGGINNRQKLDNALLTVPPKSLLV